MNERTRYRVTGSVFLIALAVICLPMVFDGAGAPLKKAPPIPKSSITPSPLRNFDEVVPTSDVVERVQELRSEVDAEGFTTDTGTRFGEPILQPVDEVTNIWAVQAASFANLDNAKAFRSDLRAAGFEAFITSVKESSTQAKPMHRVAVGPLLSIADAKHMQASIAKQFEVSPTVVEMTQ